MQSNEQRYFDRLKQSVYEQISKEINEKTIAQIVKVNLIEPYLSEQEASSRFQKYYFNILNNEEYFLNSSNFFKEFKKNYSLQGIDNFRLSEFEKQKKEILEDIRNNKLSELYFSTFFKVKIKHGNSYQEKDLSSFFAKLIHTFRPNDYCALDNPIKDHFGLKKESFFISFFIISNTYKLWSENNKQIIQEIRKQFQKADKNETIKHNQLTNLKILDLIFWHKANS
ncbi:MAG TPA: hypothetical protein VGB95_01785 [Chitinophagales bacterium]